VQAWRSLKKDAKAKLKAVEKEVAARANAEKDAKSAKDAAEGSEAEDGVWHCDACWKAQDAPTPDEGAGRRHCAACRRQWEAGWAAAREQLPHAFGTLQDSDGEVLGLCRKCGLPLGERAYDDDTGQATLHEECMAQLKFVEVQVKEQARIWEVEEKKRADRALYDIGWSMSRLPCSRELASKLGCGGLSKRSLCGLVLDGPTSIRVIETQEPAAVVNLEYLSLALQVRLHEGREPMFSLDPVHRSDELEKSTQLKHYEPEWLMGTTAGDVMFQADYHLKELSMGEYDQPIVGMKSMFDFSEAEDDGRAWNAREWFTVTGAEIHRSADGVLLPRVEMSVEAREQIEGPNGLEDAKSTRADHPMVKYAEEFTHNFDLIAERKSVVFHLRELAKASVLAKFLLDTQVTLDEAWFNAIDWPSVKEAAAACSLEIPQLWHDRYRNRISLYSGAALGTRDGVATMAHSVYGGVQFGLDRFSLPSARQLPVAAHLRATLAPGPSVAAGLLAQTMAGPRSARHAGPRGVDLNLDGFDLTEAMETALEKPIRPLIGAAFWSHIHGGDAAGDKDSAMLRDVFNPRLSDRSDEADRFIGPDPSTPYMQKLRGLIEEEAKVRQQRQDKFFSKDFVIGESGLLFPSSWTTRIDINGGRQGQQRELHERHGSDISLKELKSVGPVFERSTEDGAVFRIFRHGSLEVRTVQVAEQEEKIGVVFSTLPESSEKAADDCLGNELAEGGRVVRVTEHVSAAEATGGAGPAADGNLRYFLVLETEEGRTIALEKLQSGAVTWTENPGDPHEWAPGSRVVGSMNCYKAGITVAEMRRYRAAYESSKAASAAECRRFADGVYSRAWAFSSPDWRRAEDPLKDPPEGRERDAEAVRRGRLAALGQAAAKLRADPAAVRAAVEADGSGLERAAEELRADPTLVSVAVRENGTALRFAAESLRDDRTIVLAAVDQDALALQHASDGLRADAEVALRAVQGNSFAIDLAAERARGSPDLILASLQRNDFAIEHATSELLADRAFNLAAVRRNARALEGLPAGWRADRSFMMEVLERNGFALMYASDELRADPEVVLAALENDRRAIEYADCGRLGLKPGADVLEELRDRVGPA